MIVRERSCLFLVADAIELGYSKQDAHAVVGALQLGRVVIDTKHHAYQDKLESEKVEALTRREWIRNVRDILIPESQMEEADIRWVSNLMFKFGQQDHDPVSQLGVKIERPAWSLKRFKRHVIRFHF